jgi:hypothetical protein
MKAGTLDGISYLHSSQRSIGLLSQVLGHAGPKHGGEDEYDDCRDQVEYGSDDVHRIILQMGQLDNGFFGLLSLFRGLMF